MKMFKNVQKDERVDWSGYTRFIETNKSLTRKNMIEEMIIKAPEMFKEAEALVKLNE
jgi:chemotaxis methyl-accepting protein methylase